MAAKARLQTLMERLGTYLTAKGQSVTGDETLTALIEKVPDIETGIDTSDATAIGTDILNGETAYVDGAKITGSMLAYYTTNITVNSEKSFSFTVPLGDLTARGFSIAVIVANGSASNALLDISANVVNGAVNGIIFSRTAASSANQNISNSAFSVAYNNNGTSTITFNWASATLNSASLTGANILRAFIYG